MKAEPIPKLVALKERVIAELEAQKKATKSEAKGSFDDQYDWIAWLEEETPFEVISEAWDSKGRKVRIICPNAEEHSDGDTSGTYFGVSEEGRPWFKCHHGHCEEKFGQDGPEGWFKGFMDIVGYADITVNGRPIDAHSRSHSLSNKVSSNEPEPKIQAVSLRGRDRPGPREWLVDKALLKGHASTWYGEGGIAKSFLAAHLGISLASPGIDTWAGMSIQTVPVIYADFELDEEEHLRRWQELAWGMGLDDIPELIYYLPLFGLTSREAFHAVVKECDRLGAGLTVIDSVGFALEGDSEAAKDVLDFHKKYMQPIRAVGTTPLLIDHQGKIIKGEKYADKSEFGSVYKKNSTRSSFQIRGAWEDDGLTATFTHKKTNFGPLLDAFSLKISFEPGVIKVERLGEAIPNPDREPSKKELVLKEIAEAGRTTAEAVSESTGINIHTVRNSVSELLNEGDIVDTGEKQGRSRIVSINSDLQPQRTSSSLGTEQDEEVEGGSQLATHSHTTKGKGTVATESTDGWTPEEVDLRERHLSGEPVRFAMHKNGPHARFKDWVEERGELFYVGRYSSRRGLKDSDWRNTFKEGVDGTREEVVRKFKEERIPELLQSGKDPEEYRGKALGCWCSLDEPCHADALLELLNDSNFSYVTTPEQLTEAISKLSEATLVGLDLETVGLYPDTGTLRLVQVSDGELTFVVDAFMVDPKPLLEAVATKEIVAHNALFELEWIEHLYSLEPETVHDTMLMSQVVHAGVINPHNHGLLEVAKRELGVDMDKAQQQSDWSATELYREQLEYAALDAKVLPELYRKLKEAAKDA